MIYLGTSGYSYEDWRERFYPRELPPEQWLEYYSQHFKAVEINLTFYRLPASPVFRHWQSRTPDDFRFVLKGSQLITHTNRLRECHEQLAEFFERASELGEKLSGVLWQLPPKFPHASELLEEFLAEVARVQIVYGKFRQAFEFRDISWFDEPVYTILKNYNAAVVLADWPFDLRIRNYELGIGEEIGTKANLRSTIEVPLTSDFLYLRLHGPAAAVSQPYAPGDIQKFAELVRSVEADECDGYIFFHNTAQAYAIQNATEIKNILEV